MSILAIPSTVNSTLPAANVHPHGHGHKKGSPLDATDSSSDTAAQIPVGTAQNLFGSMFASLQKLIGAKLAPAATNPAASTTNAAASSAAAGSAAAPKINVMA
jgi:hypothetical protein